MFPAGAFFMDLFSGLNGPKAAKRGHMPQKIALFPFREELPCFTHVLLNALDMHEKGCEACIVMEGASVKLVAELSREDNPLHKLYAKAKGLGLIAGVCKGCAHMLGATQAAKDEGLALLDDMNGHPGMFRYINEGWTVITF